MEGRKRDYQTKTYSKYPLPKRKKDGRDYKICRSDEKIFQQPKNKAVMCKTSAATKPEVVAQLVNKMRALIQEMKTTIGAVTGNSPNTRVATSQEKQAKPDSKNPRALTSEVTSVAGPLQTPSKMKTKGNPLLLDGQGHGTKQRKIDPRMRTTPRKDRFELMETEASICQTGKIQMNNKMKNEKLESTFKIPSRTKSYI